LVGVDLLNPEEYEVPHRYGLTCTMGYVDAGTIPDAMNRLEHHADIEAALRKNIPLAAKAGVPNVITFSGNRKGMSDEEGARNTIVGLNRVKKIAEDNGVTLCLELLNSKVNHPDYMRPDCQHNPEHRVDRALPHRRRARPARTRQYAGSAMGRRHARHCRHWLQRIRCP
jgi:sugar phosphate isomerase/epimerase